MIKALPQIFISLAIVSCATSQKPKKNPSYTHRYKYFDISGEYLVEKKFKIKGNKMISKVKMYDHKGSDQPVEESILVSALGVVKGKQGKASAAVRPVVSQYETWFDGKKYFTQIKLSEKLPEVEVIMKSPEKKWLGKKTVKVPKEGVYCFMSQIIECLNFYGITRKAIKQGKGSYQVNIIRDSYPYYTEQIAGVSESPIFTGIIRYDEKKGENYRFELTFEDQNILYDIDNYGALVQVFWMSQGISMERL